MERFRQLYTDNYTRLIGYARRRTPTSDDASDVVADTFFVAWRNLQKVPRGDGATPWLFGIARGVLTNQQRSARRRSQLAQRVGYELQRRAESPAPSTSDLQPIAEAFGRLSSMDQEILSLCAWEGLGPKELAIALDCSVGAAKVRLFRARARMKKSLEWQKTRESRFEQLRRTSIELVPPHLAPPSTSARSRQ
jgi:RNA polymerase sigma-70 factor (ECF subfamily)